MINFGLRFMRFFLLFLTFFDTQRNLIFEFFLTADFHGTTPILQNVFARPSVVCLRKSGRRGKSSDFRNHFVPSPTFATSHLPAFAFFLLSRLPIPTAAFQSLFPVR
jgi:hypothetical protein